MLQATRHCLIAVDTNPEGSTIADGITEITTHYDTAATANPGHAAFIGDAANRDASQRTFLAYATAYESAYPDQWIRIRLGEVPDQLNHQRPASDGHMKTAQS